MAKVHYVTEEEIIALINKGMTREEAEYALIDKYDEIVFPDEDPDRAEQHKRNLKIANVYDNKKGKRTRTIKPDEDKRHIIEVLREAIAENVETAEVVNIERQIDFTFNGAEYSVTLTKHRKGKG